MTSPAIWIDLLYRDIRLALSSLAKAPVFVAIAIVTLGLGSGANIATFSILKTVALSQLPYRDPQRLVTIAESDGLTSNPQNVAFPTVYDWRLRSHSFETLCLWRDFGIRPVENGHAGFIRGMKVNYDFFDTLGIKMHLGRSFSAEDDRPATANKLILSNGLWMRWFGGKPSAVGTSVAAKGSEYPSFTIVGVLPADFHPLHMSNPGEVPELFAPLGYTFKDHSCRSCRQLRLIGRLRPDATLNQARGELNKITRDLAREHPADYAQDASVIVTPFRDELVGQFSTALWILFGAVGLLLLLACANVVNLLLARATGRKTETAIRLALGASRARLVCQMLAEGFLISFAGAVFGTVLAYWVTRVIAQVGAREIPRIDEIGPDMSLLLWGLFVSGSTGLLCSVAPAWQAARSDPQNALRAAATASHGRSTQAFLTSLIVAEIALAFVLVLGAGLLGKSYKLLLEVNPGYDPRNVLTLSLLPDWDDYGSFEQRLAYFETVAARMRGIPGVETAGYASTLPLSHPDARRFYVREQVLPSGEAPHIDTYFVSPQYFHALRIRLLRGRLIEENDKRGLEPVAVISESCARKQFGNEDPIGKHVRADGEPWAPIVGIVGDVRQYGLDRDPDAALYLALVQATEPQGWGSLVVRTTLAPERIEPAVRAAMRAVDPMQPIFHVQPMDAYVAKSLAQRTLTLALTTVFGALALLLAVAGIYGVISYAVAMRTREVGIRIALGAKSSDVIITILRGVLLKAGLGLAIGFGLSLLFTRTLASLLFGIKASDPESICAVAALILSVALAAGYVPARRAARVDPISALRCE